MSLQFELSTHAATEWLQSLSHSNSVNAANQLNKVIKELRAINSESDEVFKILTRLTPTVLFITANIESSLLKEKTKTRVNPQKIEKLCIQLLRNLSLAFYSFTDNEALTVDNQNQALYTALQLLGYTQRTAAIFHQFSSNSIWQVISELYQLADQRHILHQQIDIKIKEFKLLPTIETVIKRNLLFSMLSPYQHSSDQTKELFTLSEQHAPLLNLNRDNSSNNIFDWEPENQTPPVVINSIQAYNNTSIKIDPSSLLALIQSTSFKSALEQETLKTIIEKLSGFSVIKKPQASALLINRMVVGFHTITEYLEKVEKLNKIEQLSSQMEHSSFHKTGKEEPMDFTKNIIDSPPIPAQSSSSLDKLLAETKSVKIIKTKQPQFIIAETHSINCHIGDITLLCTSNTHHELGIIRQTRITNQSGTIHILIEKMSGHPFLLLVKSPETTDNKMICIQKIGTLPEVYLPGSTFSNGAQIKSAILETFTLDRLVDHSPYYNHYRICMKDTET